MWLDVMGYLKITLANCGSVKLPVCGNPSNETGVLIWWAQEHVGVCVYMLIFKIWEVPCPPEIHRGIRGFPVQHLTLSRSLPLVHHYKETTAPHFSFSQVTIETRPRKARAVCLDLNSVAVETRHGQTRRAAGRSCGGLGFYCHRFEK